MTNDQKPAVVVHGPVWDPIHIREWDPFHIKTWKWMQVISFQSFTMAWSYFMLLASALMEVLFMFPDVDLQFNLGQYVPSKYLPVYTASIAGITIMARMRGIIWQRDKIQDYIQRHTDGDEEGNPHDQPNR